MRTTKLKCKRIGLWFLLMGYFAAIQAQNNILVLGITQDGGYPHIGCEKPCCQRARNNDSNRRFVVSLAVVDSINKQWWLIEATPDIGDQLHLFDSLTHHLYSYLPNGIFITHAHIGHYAGLMQLGREAMGTQSVPVYVMPKMKQFLETNGPWSQLVSLHNMTLQSLSADSSISLTSNVHISPFLVPHRDEFSETCGFTIQAGGQNYLFIPDINKWELWDKSIIEEVQKSSIAFLDCTFYDGSELPGRNLSEIPHPTFLETRRIFSDNFGIDKIRFIHFNHSNPLLWKPEFVPLHAGPYQMAVQGSWY